MSIDELIEQGEIILASEHEGMLGPYVDTKTYDPWKRLALMYLQQHYPNHPQVKTFEEHVSHNNEPRHCRALVSILKAFKEIEPNTVVMDYDGILSRLLNRFHIIERQLSKRYKDRPTLKISDEYDVQDLLHALLREHFDDVRPEEWTPSYAGGCNRMDFLLKEEEIAIEVKMTREGLRDKELGEQLIIDIAKYEEHPNCKQLYCFVYDPSGKVRNPRGLEKDLEKKGNKIGIRVFIRPE